MENLIRLDYKEFHPIEVITFERIMKVPKFYNIYHINHPEFIPKRYNQGLCPLYKFEPEYNKRVIPLCYESPFHRFKEDDFIFDFGSKGIINSKYCNCNEYFFLNKNDIGNPDKCICHRIKINIECQGCLFQYLYKKITYSFFMERHMNFIQKEYTVKFFLKDNENLLKKGSYLILEDEELRYFKYLRNDTIRYILLYLYYNKNENEIYEKIFNNLIWFIAYKLYLYKLEAVNPESCPCIQKVHSYKNYIPFETYEPIYTMIIKKRNFMYNLHNNNNED